MADKKVRTSDLNSRQRVLTLAALLSLTAMATGLAGVLSMYQTGFNQAKQTLTALARGEARLLVAIAHHVRDTAHDELSQDQLLRETLAHVSDLEHQNSILDSDVELVFGRYEEGALRSVRAWRKNQVVAEIALEPPVRDGDRRARPMQLVLAGRSGTIMAHDYDDRLVLAAFEPVPVLGGGVVAKSSFAEVVQPILTAMAGSLGVALLLTFGGVALFLRKLNPVLREVERSEARLRGVLTNAAEGIITVADDGTIVDFNHAAEEIFGYRTDEAIGRSIDIILPQQYRGRHELFVQHYLAGGNGRFAGQRTEFEGTRRNGSRFVLELVVSETTVGRQKFYTGIVNDITVRRGAEDALYEAKAQLERRVTERTAELQYSNRLLRAMNDVQSALHDTSALEGTFDHALRNLFTLTGSNGGFVAELTPGSRGQLWLCYQAVQEPTLAAGDAVDTAGLMPQIRQAASQGTPWVATDGPPRLLLPINHRGQTIGVALLAGAESYDLGQANRLEPFMAVCGALLHHAQLEAEAERARAQTIEAQRQLENIIATVPDVIFRTDREGRITWVSPSVYHLSGRHPPQLVGRLVTQNLVEADAGRHLAEALSHNDDTVYSFEGRLRHADRNIRWISATVQRVHGADGESAGLVGVVRDVTAHKAALARIRELNRLYDVLSEANRAIVHIGDKQRFYEAICRAVVHTGGVRMAWIGEVTADRSGVVTIVHDGYEADYMKVVQDIRFNDTATGRGPTAQAITSGQAVVINDVLLDPRMAPWREAALARGYRANAAFPFNNGGRPAGALMVYADTPGYFDPEVLRLFNMLADDISHALDVLEKEQGRRDATERLRQLAVHLETVREHERVHLSREIHDDLGGNLTALKMDMNWLKRRCAPEDSPIQEKLTAMATLADQTIQALRRIITELRPALLDDLGLIPAVEWQLTEFMKRTGLSTELRLGKVPDISRVEIPGEVAVAAFRTLQEALTNVLKHADAHHITVLAYLEGSDFVLVINDDGRGVEPEQLHKRGSYGILGMRERTHNLGGSLDITPLPQGGTSVTLRLPLGILSTQEELPL